MKILSSTLRPILIAVACASIAACADRPPRSPEVDYRSEPSAAPRDADSPSDQRLIIQSGEGERLNLPWFIRDTQDWINSN